jgi:NAD(P)-dependent dehydrogenase (short-subunit alcohol dehydrogenase family)
MTTVVIAGASRGIGLALARQYAEQGARTHALARDPDSAEELRALGEKHANLSVHKVDVAKDEDVDSFAASMDSDRVDILVNVAGITDAKGIEGRDWDQWHRSLEIMTLGPLRTLQALLPKMGEGSKAMSLSSQVAASTWPMGGYYSYRATKGALNQMMSGVALDLKDRGIVVGLLHPGYVQTDMGGPAAEITPDESAKGIRGTIDGWTLEDSGAFRKWNGEPHDW